MTPLSSFQSSPFVVVNTWNRETNGCPRDRLYSDAQVSKGRTHRCTSVTEHQEHHKHRVQEVRNWIVTEFSLLFSDHLCVKCEKTYLSLLTTRAYIPFRCFCDVSSSDLSVTLCGWPYDTVTQLREIPVCKSPLLKCILRGGWLRGCQLMRPSF